jgi:hypothetical protein
MFVAKGYYPSNMKHDYKSSRDTTSNKHIIIFQPNIKNHEEDYIELSKPKNRFNTMSFIVAICHKGTSCFPSLKYSIWAIGSTNPPESQHVTKAKNTTTALKILSRNSPEDLWSALPRLQRQAHVAAKEKTRMQQYPHDGVAPDIEALLSEEEFEEQKSFENFVTKAGRMKLKQAIQNRGEYDSVNTEETNRLEVVVDPNMHSDLFISVKEKSDHAFKSAEYSNSTNFLDDTDGEG